MMGSQPVGPPASALSKAVTIDGANPQSPIISQSTTLGPSTMYNRPDRPLVVKCSYDSWNKKITFSSARNCSFEVLKHKVEQCFSLSSTTFSISYKDDDGEITVLSTESDLTEAIQYFHAGDDAPLSSAASILSGRSFGSRKVTLRVDITVEYDGPSLSDAGSLISLDEYQGRNGSQQSFSFTSSSSDLDDDSVTVSSRDNSAASASSLDALERTLTLEGSERFTMVSGSLKLSPRTVNDQPQHTNGSGTANPRNPFADLQVESDNVFEHLKSREALADGWSSVGSDVLERNDRGAAWLKDQSERAIRSRLGPLPEPSEPDGLSIPPDMQEELGGELELEIDPRGKYYYTYTSAGPPSQSHESGDEYAQSNSFPPRPTSMQLDWLASQQISPQTPSASSGRSLGDAPSVNGDDRHIDKEFLPFLANPVPPPKSLTDCSECGAVLDAIRYVCSTCGEKAPIGGSSGDKKGKTVVSPWAQDCAHRSLSSITSWFPPSLSSSTDNLTRRHADLPQVPSGSPLSSSSTLTQGYELCSNCLQSAGVNHAISGSSCHRIPSPTSPEDSQAASQWRRAAPKKGQLRHAFHEKVWGHTGWEDVEQDETRIAQCSTCSATTFRRRYKCASCKNINLCRACYGQVHELHPSHAFLAVPDCRVRFQPEPEPSIRTADVNEEQSLKHPGVKCAHCLLDIVGARFHCAICDSVDICANCESAGLPGNLDSADGGHTSSHILIKIPYPLEINELENASRRAIHLWTGRDAASVGLPVPLPKPGSVVSSYARTVVGSASNGSKQHSDDHRVACDGCDRPIIGVRYQCATCPSLPRAYNLCQNCEPQSYILHDPMHVFFKLPRPVRRPIEFPTSVVPLMYRRPVGSEPNSATVNDDPKAYLQTLVHNSALCDRCMTSIVGEWFRCAYCARDLCDACEEVDTHDDSHVFMVFKSDVDMQLFRTFANLDGDVSPAVIPYPVYR